MTEKEQFFKYANNLLIRKNNIEADYNFFKTNPSMKEKTVLLEKEVKALQTEYYQARLKVIEYMQEDYNVRNNKKRNL
ncbi:MAG: hypothetical protein PHP92_05715 [Candidatus Nanoarchaeia archaeon]|nr:hypothetical protein [Candidatus Nanoarchaeia archaeon]